MGMLNFGAALSAVGDGVGDAVGAVTDTARAVGEAVGDTAHDVGAGLFGWDSVREQENRERAERAMAEGRQRRAALERRNRSLEAGVSGYDPPSITDQTNWEAFSHREIFERNRKIRPDRAEQIQRAWQDIGRELGSLGDRFSPELRGKIADGWEGTAADAASRAGDPLARWMRDSGDSFQLTANRISAAGSAAGQVKAMVAEPVEPGAAESFGRGIGAAMHPSRLIPDTIVRMHEQREAERQAQQTMHRVLGATFLDVDSQVPAYKDVHHRPVPPPEPPPRQDVQPLPPPVDPSQVNPTSTTTASTSVGDAVPSTRASASSSGNWFFPSTPNAPEPAGTGSAWTSGGNGIRRPRADEKPSDPAARPEQSNKDTSGAVPLVGTETLAAAGAAAAERGGTSGGGTPRTASGPPASDARPPGTGGRAGAGAVGSPAGATSSAPGASGSGTRGAPAVGDAARRDERRGEDEEHDRPSWLEENDEVWLNDMPRVAPPVFGE